MAAESPPPSVRDVPSSLAGALGVLLAVLTATPAGLAAQGEGPASGAADGPQSLFRVDARAGIAFPTADLKDYADEGLVLGAGVAARIAPRLAVRLDGTSLLMSPADRRPLRAKGVDIPAEGSETDLHYLTAGLQTSFNPDYVRAQVRLHAGAGVVLLSTEATELAEGGDFTQFATHGGVELGFRLSDRVRLLVRGDVYVHPFREGAPSHLLKEVTLPVTGGMSVGL